MAKRILSWEISWMKYREIPEGKRGCFSKTKSWLDEDVRNHVREWLAGAGEDITGYKLAQVVGEYLQSKRAVMTLKDFFGAGGDKIRARTARRLLVEMGFECHKVEKGVYVDGHAKSDVVEYREKVFLPRWKGYERRMLVFKEDGTWEQPEGESKFNAGDAVSILIVSESNVTDWRLGRPSTS